MKHSTVLHLNRSRLYRLMVENRQMVLFTGLFVVSLLTAAFLFRSGKVVGWGEGLYRYVINHRIAGTFSANFLSSLCLSFAFLLGVYLFGTSLLGVAFIPFLIMLRGFLIGLFLCRLYEANGFAGIAYNLLIVIPSACLYLPTMLCGANSSLHLSISLGRLLFGDATATSKSNVRRFLLLFVLLLFLTVLSALLSGLMSVAFIKYFEMG